MVLRHAGSQAQGGRVGNEPVALARTPDRATAGGTTALPAAIQTTEPRGKQSRQRSPQSASPRVMNRPLGVVQRAAGASAGYGDDLGEDGDGHFLRRVRAEV